jgi:hypothetical protein
MRSSGSVCLYPTTVRFSGHPLKSVDYEAYDITLLSVLPTLIFYDSQETILLSVCLCPQIYSFSRRSVPYQKIVGDWFFPELLSSNIPQALKTCLKGVCFYLDINLFSPLWHLLFTYNDEPLQRLPRPYLPRFVTCKRQVYLVFTCCCIATETCGIVLLRIGYRCSQHVGGFHERLPQLFNKH